MEDGTEYRISSSANRCFACFAGKVDAPAHIKIGSIEIRQQKGEYTVLSLEFFKGEIENRRIKDIPVVLW